MYGWWLRIRNRFSDGRDDDSISSSLARPCSACVILLDQAIKKRDQLLACAGQNECGGVRVPVELEAGGKRRDPHLADRGVGRNDKLAACLFKDDIQDAVLLFHFKAGLVVFFLYDQMLLEGINGGLGRAAKFLLVHHGPSVQGNMRVLMNMVRLSLGIAGFAGGFMKFSLALCKPFTSIRRY